MHKVTLNSGFRCVGSARANGTPLETTEYPAGWEGTLTDACYTQAVAQGAVPAEKTDAPAQDPDAKTTTTKAKG